MENTAKLKKRVILNCARCGWKWVPRKDYPQTCPHCRSPYWNSPYMRKLHPENKAKRQDVPVLSASDLNGIESLESFMRRAASESQSAREWLLEQTLLDIRCKLEGKDGLVAEVKQMDDILNRRYDIEANEKAFRVSFQPQMEILEQFKADLKAETKPGEWTEEEKADFESFLAEEKAKGATPEQIQGWRDAVKKAEAEIKARVAGFKESNG